MKKWIKPAAVLVLLAGLIIIARVSDLDQRFIEFREWVAARGITGPVIFAGVYALAAILALPGSVLTIMAGAVFGSITGFITVTIGANVGAALSFLISRYLARDLIVSLMKNNEKFKKLDNLTEKNGAIIVAITRLVPIFPFNILNYGFGLTRVPFRTYVLWTFLCMLPGTLLYIVGTDVIITAFSEARIPWILVSIAVAAIIILTVIARKAKSSLRE